MAREISSSLKILLDLHLESNGCFRLLFSTKLRLPSSLLEERPYYPGYTSLG